MTVKIFISSVLFVLSVLIANAQDTKTYVLSGLDTIKSTKAKIDFLNETALEAINNDPEEAKSYATQAMKLAKKEKYNNGIAYAYYNFGNVNYYLDEYKEGLLNLDSAQNIFETEQDEKVLGFVFNTILTLSYASLAVL